MWSRPCVWEHISPRVEVSFYFLFLNRCRHIVYVSIMCTPHISVYNSSYSLVSPCWSPPKNFQMQNEQHLVWPLIILVVRHFQHTWTVDSGWSSAEWLSRHYHWMHSSGGFSALRSNELISELQWLMTFSGHSDFDGYTICNAINYVIL